MSPSRDAESHFVTCLKARRPCLAFRPRAYWQGQGPQNGARVLSLPAWSAVMISKGSPTGRLQIRLKATEEVLEELDDIPRVEGGLY